MASQELANLSCIIYEDTYGKLGARILEVLLSRGRTTAPELAKITGLAPSAVMRTLVSLVQNRFVFWWHGPRKTHYVANWARVYSILWSGEVLTTFVDHTEVLQGLIVDGSLRVEDIKKRYPTVSQQEIEGIVRNKILVPLHVHDFWPPEELKQDLQAKHLRRIMNDHHLMGLSEAHKKDAVDKSTDAELEELGRLSERHHLEQNSVLGINFDRFLIASRRRELVEFARRLIGEITAIVYEQLLLLSEVRLKSRSERRLPCDDANVTTFDIVKKLQQLPEKVDLYSAFLEFQDESEETENGTNGAGNEDDDDVKEESSAKRAKLNSGKALAKMRAKAMLSKNELVNKHLQLLEDSPARFLKRVGDRQGGEWFVGFDDAVEDLRRETFDTIVTESFGFQASRLLRIIRLTGKMDEKMLASKTLLHATEIRHQMSTLHAYGLVDIQEIPRPGDRNSQKRSFYLWYHRPVWAYTNLTQFLYRAINQKLVEVRELRQQHQILLNKLERDDVQKDKEAYLTQKEKDELRELEQAERELYGQVYMNDRHVRIFRDY